MELDLTALQNLDGAAVLHCLKQRWQRSGGHNDEDGGKQPYSFIFPLLIALNPCERLRIPRHATFRDAEDNARRPHPFALAEFAFQKMSLAHLSVAKERSAINQCIIISGESGAGKTETAKMILPYLTKCSDSSEENKNGESGAARKSAKPCAPDLASNILQTNPIFEAFGNAKTLRNHNSSRFGKFIECRFRSSPSGGGDLRMMSARLDVYLLERSRVAGPSHGERNFHAFYQLLRAPSEVKRRVGLVSASGTALAHADFEFLQTGCYEDDHLDDAALWAETDAALKACGVTLPDKDLGIWGIAAAILLIGNLSFSEGQATSSHHLTRQLEAKGGEEAQSQQPCCAVYDQLGPSCKLPLIAKLLQLGQSSSGEANNDGGARFLRSALTVRTLRTMDETFTIPLSPVDAARCRDGLARALYEAMFVYLTDQINVTTLKCNEHDENDGPVEDPWIGILDIFGFEHFDQSNGFHTFLINYANEAVQAFYLKFFFEAEKSLYEEEGISLNEEDSLQQGASLSAVPSGSIFVYPDNYSCTEALKGIFKAMEDVCREPEPSDAKFLRRVSTDLKIQDEKARSGKGGAERSRASSRTSFVSGGQRGIHLDQFAIVHFAGTVTYTVDTWCVTNVDLLPQGPQELFESSSSPVIRHFAAKKARASSLSPSSSTYKNHPASSFITKATVAGSFVRSMESLIVTLRNTECAFIRCIKPNAALSPKLIDEKLVAEQLQSLGIVQTCEILKCGLPTRLPLSVLSTRCDTFTLPLRGDQLWKNNSGLLLRVALLLRLYCIDDNVYCIGETRVFFKAGQMSAIRRILTSSPPMIEKAEEYLRRYSAAIHGALAVMATFGAAWNDAEKASADLKVQATRFFKCAQEKALILSDALATNKADDLDVVFVRERRRVLQSLNHKVAAEPRLIGVDSASSLLNRAHTALENAISGADAFTSNIVDAIEAGRNYRDMLSMQENDFCNTTTACTNITEIIRNATSTADKRTVENTLKKAALRLEARTIAAMERRSKETKKPVESFVASIKGRKQKFLECTDPKLRALEACAVRIINGSAQKKSNILKELAKAEAIVKPGGDVETVWIDNEMRLLAANAAQNYGPAESGDSSSLPLLVNCRWRRHGWRMVGEELLRINPQSIRHANKDGINSLAAASHAGHTDVVDFLISKGCDVSRGNIDGTPLASAAAQGNIKEVEMLTSAGASIARGNADGDSSLVFACFLGDTCCDYLCHFSKNGLRANFVDTAVHQAEVLHACNSDGVTPLEVACMRGNLKAVHALHEYGGVSLDALNGHGDTPMTIACCFGHLRIVEYIYRVEGLGSADRPNANQDTPLAVASSEGHLEVVRFLLAVGVSADVRNADGLTAYDTALTRGRAPLISFFNSKGVFNSRSMNLPLLTSTFSSESTASVSGGPGSKQDSDFGTFTTEEKKKPSIDADSGVASPSSVEGRLEQLSIKTSDDGATTASNISDASTRTPRLSQVKDAARFALRRLMSGEEEPTRNMPPGLSMETADQESNSVDEATNDQRVEPAAGRIMLPSSSISPARRDLLSSLSFTELSPVSSADASAPQAAAGSEDRGGAGTNKNESSSTSSTSSSTSRAFHEVKGSKSSSHGIPVPQPPPHTNASNSAMPSTSATTVEQARTQLSWPDKETNFGDQMTKLDGIKPRYRRNKKSFNAISGASSSSEEEDGKEKRGPPHQKSISTSFKTPTRASNSGEPAQVQAEGSFVDPPVGNHRAALMSSPHFKNDKGPPEQRQTVAEEEVQLSFAAPAASASPIAVAATTQPKLASHVPSSVQRTPARMGRPLPLNEPASSMGGWVAAKESGIRTITKGSAGKSDGNGLNVFVSSDDPRLAPHTELLGLIEYNGHDAFEFGAMGEVMACLDARVPTTGSEELTTNANVDALFTIQPLEHFQPKDRSKALLDTDQLLRQLETLLLNGHATTTPLWNASYLTLPPEPEPEPEAEPEPAAKASRPRRGLRGMKLKNLRGAR